MFDPTSSIREQLRLRGDRRIPQRAIGATLLLKGLVCDHSLIFNATIGTHKICMLHYQDLLNLQLSSLKATLLDRNHFLEKPPYFAHSFVVFLLKLGKALIPVATAAL